MSDKHVRRVKLAWPNGLEQGPMGMTNLEEAELLFWGLVKNRNEDADRLEEVKLSNERIVGQRRRLGEKILFGRFPFWYGRLDFQKIL